MDYKRIYAAFIKDRRAKEPALQEYSERHHIVPRSMGGGDEPENLIRLTPEDHFFAHLLLAKIHGGRQWAPIAFMIGGKRKDYKPIVSRRGYGWAARAMARAASGENAHQYDWTIYRLEHKDGRLWSGTQAAMHDELGLGRSLANLLVKRKIGSAKGWFHEGQRPKHVGRGSASGNRHHMADPREHYFVHVSGEEFIGTRVDFCAHSGVSKKSACLIVNGKQIISKGWTLKGAIIPTQGGAAHRRQRPSADAGRSEYPLDRRALPDTGGEGRREARSAAGLAEIGHQEDLR